MGHTDIQTCNHLFPSNFLEPFPNVDSLTFVGSYSKSSFFDSHNQIKVLNLMVSCFDFSGDFVTNSFPGVVQLKITLEEEEKEEDFSDEEDWESIYDTVKDMLYALKGLRKFCLCLSDEHYNTMNPDIVTSLV